RLLMKLNRPNKITFSRIAVIPLVIFFYLANFIPYGIGKFLATLFFMIGAYTDHLDGYFARKYNQVTNLGKFLDPIADKLLVFAALVLICVDGTIVPIFAEIVLFIMLARDFIVGALRQVAASNNVIISADKWGKLKTVLQDIAISILLVYSALMTLNLSVSLPALLLQIFMWTGYIAIGLATVVSILSGINYCVKNKKVFEN
ncbi:MAG: CDP-diacylglycerol--glycerol-3-phosphate 3-phosphatidyltransferase, partial [Christensenellales bacterium]